LLRKSLTFTFISIGLKSSSESSSNGILQVNCSYWSTYSGAATASSSFGASRGTSYTSSLLSSSWAYFAIIFYC
jgi:hypothetical protein